MLHHVRTGTGPPLLLLHGIGLSHAASMPIAQRLAAERECYAVDLPGFGASRPLDGAPTLDALATACADFMAARGHARFHVAGNSLGGGIALHLALTGRALSACALSPIGFVEGWERAYVQLSLRTTKAVGPFVPTRFAGSALLRRVSTAQLVVDGAHMTPGQYQEAFAALNGSRRFFSTARHAINWRAPAGVTPPVPVTVAWGERDRLLLTRPQSARARERLPGADHVTLHGCGHLPAFDDPDQVARVVLAATTVA